MTQTTDTARAEFEALHKDFDQPSGARLVVLHEDIASHLLQLRRALYEHITALQQKKQHQHAGTLQENFQEGRTS